MGRSDHKDPKETLTSLHRRKVQEINDAESTLSTLGAKLCDLEARVAGLSLDNLEYKQLTSDIKDLKESIASIKSERIKYQLKNGELLYRISEAEKVKKNTIIGINALRQRRTLDPSTLPTSQSEYYQKFRSNIDPDYVYIAESNLNDDNYCFECKEFKVLYPEEAITICETCGQRNTTVTNIEKPSMKVYQS